MSEFAAQFFDDRPVRVDAVVWISNEIVPRFGPVTNLEEIVSHGEAPFGTRR